MKLQVRLLYVGIASAYVLSLLGVHEDLVSTALACGYLLIALRE